MILAFDTYYYDEKARTICLAFESWEAVDYQSAYSEELENIADYTPGEFYKRELPCILSLLKKIGPEPTVEAIIVDGFVYLDDEGKPGLGARLHEALDKSVPVIGVAKTNFATIERLKREVFRGESKRPLYITAVGADLEAAAENVRRMHGTFRIPDLLKTLDRYTKEADKRF